MSARARRASPRGRAGRRGPARLAAWSIRAAVVLVVFAVGVALGRALNDDSRPDGDRTYVRTLKPRPVAPAPQTVTLTVTSGE